LVTPSAAGVGADTQKPHKSQELGSSTIKATNSSAAA
jgi:hypothetical protein